MIIKKELFMEIDEVVNVSDDIIAEVSAEIIEENIEAYTELAK